MMNDNYENNNIIEIAPDEQDIGGELVEDAFTNAAIITLDHAAQQLVIFFGDDRNAVMELDNDFEFSLCETALGDPNFWANFLGSFSAAIKKSS
jgi:hypothetical protein